MGKINSQEAMSELLNVNRAISNLLLKTQGTSTYDEYNDNILYKDTPDERLMENETYRILEKLAECQRTIKYLAAPVKEEGYLHKNSKGRYELNGNEYTSGCGVEVYMHDTYEQQFDWSITRIEHDGNDYYAVGYQGVSLEGVRVRKRDI